MNGFLSEDKVRMLRCAYRNGTRVKLIRMSDPYSRLEPGDCGTVSDVDDAGTIHVNWDCGSTLGLIYGEDSFVKI